MSASHQPIHSNDVRPVTLKYCKTCRRETSHEIRCASGASAAICLSCLKRALAYEMERE